MKNEQGIHIPERDVRELELGDMLIQVFRRWIILILAAVIGAALFTGYSCLKGISGPRAAQAVAEAQAAQENAGGESELYQTRMDGMNVLRSEYMHTILGQSRYIQNSIMLQLNPYAVNRASAALYVYSDSENDTDANSLVNVYASAATSAQVLQPIAEDLGTEYQYLNEVIEAETDYDANAVLLTVSYTDAENAERIMERILTALADRADGYSGEWPNHRIAAADIRNSVVVDHELSEHQYAVWVDLHNYNMSWSKINEDITGLRNAVVGNVSIPETRSLTMDIVIGAVVGFLVGFAVLCLAYLVSDKLRSDDEVRRMGSYRVYKNNISPEKRSSAQALLDGVQGMDRFREHSYKRFADLFVPELEEKDMLLLATTLDEADISEISEKLGAELKEALKEKKPGFEIKVCGHADTAAEAVEALRDADAVLLVERCHKSVLKSVYNELELLSHVREDVMGVMVRGI